MGDAPSGNIKDGSLLALRGMSAAAMRSLLDGARQALHDEASGSALAGVTVGNLFFEDSTRTRVSFTLAARRLGGDTVDLTASGSSAGKGETLADTARTLESMGVGILVVRDGAAGSAALVDRATACPVINAGDGRHEHPTQGLLDVYTLAEAFDRVGDFDLSGLRVGLVGDVMRSRVARSDIAAMSTLGAEVICVGPPSMAPRSLATLGCVVSHDFDDVLPTLDAAQMLRIQFERGASSGSLRSYVDGYGLTEGRASRMKRTAVVMHPGPMNRGLEISSAVADGPRSLVRRQLAVGVAVRMSALRRAAGAALGVG